MKINLFVLILIIFLIPSAVVMAEQEGLSLADFDANKKVSDDMIEILMANLDNLFPITVMREYFSKPIDPYYVDENYRSVTEIYNDAGIRNIRMFANPDQLNDHVSQEIISDVYVTDFYLTMDVGIKDTWPVGEGGCFIGFSNYGVSAFSDSDGAAMVTLLTDGKNMEIYVKGHESTSGSRFPLNARGNNQMKLSIIHMAGHTYVLIGNEYSGQIHDGIQGPFRVIYGTALFKNGDSAACSFDNLILKKLGKKW